MAGGAGGDADEDEKWAPKCRRRRVKLRPVFPRVDWMLVPNVLAYLMSWYGLFVGKFPCQVLCTVFGLAIIFTSGMYRIQIADIRPEDYLPTNSRSTIERALTSMFDYSDSKDATMVPEVIMPEPPKQTRRHSSTTTTDLMESATIVSEQSRKSRKITEKTRKSQITEKPFLADIDDDEEFLPEIEETFYGENASFSFGAGGGMVEGMSEARKVRKRRQSYLDPQGRYQNCRVNSVLLVAKRNASDKTGKSFNLLAPEVIREIERLEGAIFGASVDVTSPKSGDGNVFYYDDRDGEDNGVCTKQQSGECGGFNLRVLRSLLRLALIGAKPGEDVDLTRIGITYPNFAGNDLSQFLGRVETLDDKHDGIVKHIGAMREVFCVNEHQADWFKRAFQVWVAWEQKFDSTVRKFKSPFFDLYWIAEYQKQAEQTYLIKNMVPKVAVTFLALMIWCTIGALMNDAVRSKPWAGIIGVCATLMGCLAGFGICLWITPRFWPVIMAVPLLTLAIGLDDMFILLEAWSHTNPALPVEERIMLSMNVGGTSIVITFCINVLDFVIGNYTPYPLIQVLSTYAIATMVLDFFFQMTIFCAGLSLFGGSEQNNRHACCCCIVLPTRRELIGSKTAVSGFSLVCCAGGLPRDELNDELKSEKKTVDCDDDDDEAGQFQAKISHFLSEKLTSLPFRIFAVIGFFLYLAASVYSVTRMELGLKPERMFRKNSNLYDYTQQHRELFTAYSHEITIVVQNTVDYWRPDIQRKFVDFFDKAQATGYFWGDEETRCWVTDFISWAKETRLDLSKLKSNQDVIYHLRRYPDGFLSSYNTKSFTSYVTHTKDIRISSDATQIKRSRFRLRAKNMTGPVRQIGMMTSIRELSDRYRPEIQMFTFTNDFQMYDQYLTAVPATLYYCGMTLGCTVVVALFMIPHPACLFWVAVFVTSVLIGIIGQMRFWDMDLDSVSLINLLIAISFCSDLIAHPVYIFLISPVPKKSKDGSPMYGPEARLIKARALIEEVAAAAVPACVGTTLSVIAMSTSDAYIFMAFFRVMFLSVVLSVFHALVFVPAFLSFIGPSTSGLQAAAGASPDSSNKDEADIYNINENNNDDDSPHMTDESEVYYEVIKDDTRSISVVSETVRSTRSETALIRMGQSRNVNDGVIAIEANRERPRPAPARLVKVMDSVDGLGSTRHRRPSHEHHHNHRSRNVENADSFNNRQDVMGFLPHRNRKPGHSGLRMFYGPKRIWDQDYVHATSKDRPRDDFSDEDDYYLPPTIRPIPVVSSRHYPALKLRPQGSHPAFTMRRENGKTSASSHTTVSRHPTGLVRQSHTFPDLKPMSRSLHHQHQPTQQRRGLDCESNTISGDSSLCGSQSTSLNRSRVGVEMLPAKHRFNI